MGSSSQSPPTQTTSVQTTELPDFVQAPAQSYLARAQDLSTQPFTSYEGERVAPLNTFHQAALDGGRQAISTMLPGSMNVMNQFAQGAYNSPAYIHPFLGPQLPTVGMTPQGYVGSPGAGFQGYSPFPQAPMQSIGTGTGTGGKGGMVAAPTPVELSPVPQGLNLINNQPSAANMGGVTPGQLANPGGYATPPSQAQMQAALAQQAAQATPTGDTDAGLDDSPQGEIAYYGDAPSWLSNITTPLGALAQVGYNALTNQPNTPYVTQNLDTGQMGFSDGQSLTDALAMPADEITNITTVGGGGLPGDVAPAPQPAITPDAAFEPDPITQPATSPALMPDAFFAADQPVAQVSTPAAQPAITPDAAFQSDPIAQSPITVDDLITGIPGPQVSTVPAPQSFVDSLNQSPPNPGINNFDSIQAVMQPLSMPTLDSSVLTQPATSPALMPDAFFAANQSLPAIPTNAGPPASVLGPQYDVYETGELLRNVAFDPVGINTQPAITVDNLISSIPYYADDVGDYFSQPSYGYDGYSDFGFIGDDAGGYGGFGGDLTGGLEF